MLCKLLSFTNSFKPSSIEDCASALLKGDLAALPTETVYGLASLALDEDAVSKIFRLKGRPQTNPLIVHIKDSQMASNLAFVTNYACSIFEEFWPGPITVILKKRECVPSSVCADLDTVAVRSPSHSKFREVLSLVNAPLAAPSANKSNKVSPTTAEHVFNNFGRQSPPILDGGPCSFGLESTVLDLSGNSPAILRPGPINLTQIENCLNTPISINYKTKSDANSAQISPGQFHKHYSPETPLILMDNFEELKSSKLNSESDLILCMNSIDSNYFQSLNFSTLKLSNSGNPNEVAFNLYASLITADSFKKNRIITYKIHQMSEISSAINDRLTRSASK